MVIKKYSSYAEIEHDLEILKLEKEISYHKLVYNVQKVKESFTPKNIVCGFFGSYKDILSDTYKTIIELAIPFIIKWVLKRKRDD